MNDWRPGQNVRVPCEVSPGPFPGELLVTIRAGDQNISGFVREDDLVNHERDRGMIRGKIVRVLDNSVVVSLAGSFFTTTGVAAFHTRWAHDNLQREVAA